MQVTGSLRFPPSVDPLDVAAVHISVRDITELDAPAEIVAALDLDSLQVPASGLDVPFALEADLADRRRTYVVRAHADRSGSGSVSPGDLVTTSVHRVEPGVCAAVLLPLEPVRR